MADDQVFFVNIADAYNLRRAILLTSKEFIGLLKQHEHFVRIREQKNEEIKKLDSIMREIGQLNEDFKAKLPEVKSIKLPKMRKKDSNIDIGAASKEEKKRIVEKASSEIDELESAIDQIEQRLSKFSGG